MDNELDSAVILLVTTSTCRRGTLTGIRYSGIFVRDKQYLDSVEQNVFDMVQKFPDTWTSGCVTGYPATQFTQTEQEAFLNYGLNKRFSL